MAKWTVLVGSIANLFVMGFLEDSVAAEQGGGSRNVFRNMPLNRIHPEGWQREFLIKQRDGLTGNLDKIAEPFNVGGWNCSDEKMQELEKSGRQFYARKDKKGKDVLAWEPFEQTGYYYDGVLRCGLLLGDEFLLEKAKQPIERTIAQRSPEGVLGWRLPTRWPHAVFLRAFMALYEATGDQKILDALEQHYTNDKAPITHPREILNIEQLVWLYQQTGKKEYLARSVSLYEAEIARGTDRHCSAYADLISDEPQGATHGCTFNYMLALPIILYAETGDAKYLEAARNAYRKVDKFHMLADGLHSCEEGLSEKSELSAHETCDVSDFIWTASYMLKATGEVEWADKIERAVLNAGLGCVTKDFDAHTYLSALNQVVSQIGSSRSIIHHPAVMAYCQSQQPRCCTGNVHRFFPIYVGLQWLKGPGDALVHPLYGPSRCEHTVGGKTVTLREESIFPFSDTVKITVVEGSAAFPLHLRIPTWAKNPTVEWNGVKQEGVESGRFFVLDGKHKAGDVITLKFPVAPEVKYVGMNAAVVDYGPLLFSLPIESKTEKVLLKDAVWTGATENAKDIYGYNMVPASKWQYVLSVDKENNDRIDVVHNPVTDPNNPWTSEKSPIEIKMYAMELPKWELHYREYKPFNQQASIMMPITPPLPPRGMMGMVPRLCGKPERITLVPFGRTTLRLTAFPFWDIKDTPTFVENEIDYQQEKSPTTQAQPAPPVKAVPASTQ